ncbi:gliding motility-associated C-terminal domain-containing protein [Crocinitomicaceae bacterium]|nr:gliding motility-associated C-terminal domain-containing protein [Crocinitomicaceae bacterium]
MCFISLNGYSQVLINADVKINGFRHSWDCGNDVGGFNSFPDPRYKVWVGYNSGNFQNVNAGPGLYGGCANTYGGDAVFCSTWNPGLISAASFNAQQINEINVDMESWEDDGCGSNCNANTCFFNSDDTRCGRLRIGDVNFWSEPPCQDNLYNGDFTSGSFLSMHNRCSDHNGGGYGIDQLIINWSFATSPSIITQPFPYDRVLCPGNSTTLDVSVDEWNGWSLAQLVQWQISTNTDCNSASNWTDIPGANTLSFTPNEIPGTRLYRCVISSNCSNINTQQVLSECVRVTYHPYAAPIISPSCGTTIVPDIPIQFCTTLPPDEDASVAIAAYTWSVTPSTGVTISNTTSTCTDIIFSEQGGYTVSLTYTDVCPEADAVATCITTITPPACDMIYVDAINGDNNFLGFPNEPVANLWRAMQLVGGARYNIRITGGNYLEPNIIYLMDNVFIDGSWENNSGVWTKTSDQSTNLTFSGEEVLNNAVTHLVGLKSENISGWTLQDIDVTTINASGNAIDGRGKSNYGVLIDNTSSYEINRCTFNIGSATNGLNGANGSPGSNGAMGATGLIGHCDNNTTNRVGGTGSGFVGTGIRQGGAGGNGGMGSDWNSNNNQDGNNGSNGGGGAAGGFSFGSQGANGGCGSSSNRDGRKGQNGASGTIGANANATPEITNNIFLNYWTPNGNASSGADGTGGGGGEGGGGGGRQAEANWWDICDNGGGSGGGGGGSGGEGGQGGYGGLGGGGSFGIYRFNSNTGVIIQDITINVPGIIPGGGGPGGGGFGGSGGPGGCGGGGNNTSTTSGGATGSNGGLCSTSRVCNSTEVGAGGQGGAGGNAGNGGTGQPGASGYSTHMVVDGVFSNPSTSVPNPTTIIMEYPVNGKGCVNSEVVFSNAVSSPWILNGSTLIDDMNPGISSYTYNSNPVYTYYSNNGIYDIETSGANYQDWIHIIDDSRPANMIFNNASTICSGGTLNINGASWGTEIEWDWVIYEVDALTPIQTSSEQSPSFTMPVVTMPTVYNVRYRVRESCCGWSKPYYTTFSVNPVYIPQITANGSTTLCSGDSVELSTDSGINIQWSNGETTQSIFVNTPGQYSVTVENLDGCIGESAPVEIIINPIPNPLIIPQGSDTSICAGTTVVLEAPIGNAYLWSNGEISQSITVDSAGVYEVFYTDLNGCSASSTPYIVYETSDSVIVDGNSVICPGDSVLLTSFSQYPNPANIYQWFYNGFPISNANQNAIYANQTGIYSLSIDAGSCSVVSSDIEIIEFDASISSNSLDSVLCPGSTLDLLASPGDSFQWFLDGVLLPGETNQTLTINDIGMYTVEVIDGVCTDTSGIYSVSFIIPIISSNTGANSFCSGASIDLISSLGDSYQWALDGIDIPNANNQTYTAMQGGVYAVTVQIGSCTTSSSDFTLTEIIPIITSGGGVNTICLGETLDLSSSSADSYQWAMNGVDIPGAINQTFTASMEGSYTVTVSLGVCSNITSLEFTITEIIPIISGAGGASTLCPGNTLDLISSLADSYQWALNGVDITGATNQIYNATLEGVYTVTTVLGTCTSSSSDFNLSYLTATISSAGGNTSFCSGSDIDLTASVGTTYQWQLNGIDIPGATSQVYNATNEGTYNVVVIDGLCSLTSADFMLTEIIPIINSSNGDTSLCPGSSLDLNCSPADSYQWMLNGVNIPGATTQTYSASQGGIYSITAINGTCTSSSLDFNIVEIIPSITSNGNAVVLCPGSTLDLTSSVADSYQWSFNNVDIPGAINQIYTATVSGVYAVTTTIGTTGSATLNPNSDFELGPGTNCGSPTNYVCANDAGQVIDGIHPVWAVGNQGCVGGATNFTNSLGANSGSAYVYFYAGADNIQTNSFPFVGGETVNICVWYSGPQGVGASGQNTANSHFSLSVDGVQVGPDVLVPTNTVWTQHCFTVTMTAGNHTFGILSGGAAQYSLWFDDFEITTASASCTSTSQDFVLSEIVAEISSTNGASTLCNGNTIEISSTLADTYQWSINGIDILGETNQNINVTEPGSYMVTITSGSCALSSSAFEITDAFSQIPNISISDTIGCLPLIVDLNHDISNVSTNWFVDGVSFATTQSSQLTLDQQGCVDIELVLTSNTGCELTTSALGAICATPSPVALFSMNPSVISNDQEAINFINTSEFSDSYFWDFGNGTNSDLINPSQNFNVNDAGYLITLTAFNDAGCYDSYSVTLMSNEVGIVFVPNTFTPDGDEHNQEFVPTVIPGFQMFSYSMKIYNRWGEQVFESNNIDFGWDGSYGSNANQAQEGVYIWKISYHDQNSNERKVLSGHVTLIR